jgi:hypothetical protein
MLGVISTVSVLAGSAAATLARRFEHHYEAIETGAGLLMIGGFFLIGTALPIML